MKPLDTEDKLAWCDHGLDLELLFCEKFGERLGVSMNPEKTDNPYAPDLVNVSGFADLKTQQTPFYRAGSYGVNPLQCVVINRKDLKRYYKLYRDIQIYFWLSFEGGTSYGVSIPKMDAIFMVDLASIIRMIHDKLIPLHHYQRRGDDPVNAKSSYLIDTALLTQVYP